MKKQISAEIIADSLNTQGSRITTFIVTFPRMILAEVNTHRMFSRNSASSRAIPFKKMVKMVREDPFIPIAWQKDHKGMQGTEYFDGFKVKMLKFFWMKARFFAILLASVLNKLGLTKQLCNRILEPFMWHTAIITATDFENFFALRSHNQAEIHIEKLSDCMLEVYNTSIPKQLKTGEWHIPFGDKFDEDRLLETKLKLIKNSTDAKVKLLDLLKIKIMIATARCARVSYLNFLGKDNYFADVKLHNMLSNHGHWSPFEHCAKANHTNDYSGNFKGFTQYRKMFRSENKNDKRVVKK